MSEDAATRPIPGPEILEPPMIDCPNGLCVDGLVESDPPCANCAKQEAPCLFTCEVCGGRGEVQNEKALDKPSASK